MMDTFEDILTAARHRDWTQCSRLMFQRLYQCKADDQRTIAKVMLWMYLEIWAAKHDDDIRQLPLHLLISNERKQELPNFPEDLDPADAEFENGLVEFYNGSLFPSRHDQRTMHFATAIRSAITARQINKWLCGHPDDYAKWKTGRPFNGPTFLDDEMAASEAEIFWKLFDALVKEQPKSFDLSREPAAYRRWEETIL